MEEQPLDGAASEEPSFFPVSADQQDPDEGSWLLIVVAVGASFVLFGSAWQFRNTWSRQCDRMLKIWTLVALSRLIFHNCLLFALRRLSVRCGWPLRPFRSYMSHITTVLNLFNLCWFLYGIDPIFVKPRCDMVSWRWAVAIWSIQIILCLPPFLIVSCLVLAVHFCPSALVELLDGSFPEQKESTPAEYISKLAVKKYKEVKIDLEGVPPEKRGSLVVSRLLPETSSSAVASGAAATISALSGIHPIPLPDHGKLGTGASACSASPPTSKVIGQQSKEPTCPICFCEFEDEEDLIIMPCDTRHAFHQDCIVDWLAKSRNCPICRSDVVKTIDQAGSSSGRAETSQQDVVIEMPEVI